MSSNTFLNIIEKQRHTKKEEKFDGTFLDYLEYLKDNPDTVKLSHKRLYDAILGHGIQVMSDSNPRKNKIFNGDNIKIFDYFKDEFFGMENIISNLMRFLRSAALRGEESRQVILLMGPVGAGKSGLTEHIKKSLDGETFFHLEGDPQRGEPLQLIPRNLREKFEKILNIKI